MPCLQALHACLMFVLPRYLLHTCRLRLLWCRLLYGLALPSATNQSQGAGGEDARQRGSAVITRTAIKNIYNQ
jgi:hypothetical protein